ncbi:MAG: hypothetical protein ACYC9W_06530 [Candidatus Limnocylindria bacterium]
MRNATMSERAADLLDDARDALLGLGRTGAGQAVAGLAADGVRRIVWSGSWLDDPYVPRTRSSAPPADLGAAERRLRDLTDAFEELVEEFEEDDPVRNANGVQTGSLAFAITGATAARLHRLAASPGSRVDD